MVIEVLFLPIVATDLRSKVCVVVDELRATSTLVSMLESGVRRVTLAESIEGALALAGGQPSRPFVCGESGGLAPAGFDYGNSPREFLPDVMKGREIVFFTSNGTKAMRHVSESPVVLAGCLLNASAVVSAALREATEKRLDVSIVCSGDHLGTHFAIDDAFTAGFLCTLMERLAGTWAPEAGVPASGHGSADLAMDESAVAAMRLYRSYLPDRDPRSDAAGPPRDAILAAFWESHNAQVLRRVGLAEDVGYCAQMDISTVVPRLRVEGEALVIYPE